MSQRNSQFMMEWGYSNEEGKGNIGVHHVCRGNGVAIDKWNSDVE